MKWSKMTTYLSDRGFPFVFWSFEYKDRLSSLFAILVDCLDAPSPWSFVWLDILWDGLCESVGLKKILFYLFIYFSVFYFVGVAEFAIFLISQQARSRSQICWIRQISVMISKIHAIENSALFRVCVCVVTSVNTTKLLRRIEIESTNWRT